MFKCCLCKRLSSFRGENLQVRKTKLIAIIFLVGCTTVQTPVDVPVVIKPIETPKLPSIDIDAIVEASACKDFYYNDWDNGKQKAPLSFLIALAKSFKQADCKAEQDPAKWAELISLGLWESNANQCEGKDAGNNTGHCYDTESGAFQTSWDAGSKVQDLFRNWNGECFSEKVCSSKNYGEPHQECYKFQQKQKSCLAFSAEVVISHWENRFIHYYPFKKKMVQQVKSCVDMFQKIKELACII